MEGEGRLAEPGLRSCFFIIVDELIAPKAKNKGFFFGFCSGFFSFALGEFSLFETLDVRAFLLVMGSSAKDSFEVLLSGLPVRLLRLLEMFTRTGFVLDFKQDLSTGFLRFSSLFTFFRRLRDLDVGLLRVTRFSAHFKVFFFTFFKVLSVWTNSPGLEFK